MANPKTPIRFDWKHRRLVIRATLIYCAGVIAWLAIWGKDTSLNSAIATGLILLAASVIGSYVFGAVWDDQNARKLVARGGVAEGGEGEQVDEGEAR